MFCHNQPQQSFQICHTRTMTHKNIIVAVIPAKALDLNSELPARKAHNWGKPEQVAAPRPVPPTGGAAPRPAAHSIVA